MKGEIPSIKKTMQTRWKKKHLGNKMENNEELKKRNRNFCNKRMQHDFTATLNHTSWEFIGKSTVLFLMQSL